MAKKAEAEAKPSDAPVQPDGPTEDEATVEQPEAESAGTQEGGEQPAEPQVDLNEIKETIDNLTERLRKAEHDSLYWQTLVKGQEQPPEPTQVAEPSTQEPTQWWQDPEKGTEKVVRRVLSEWRQAEQTETEKKAREQFVQMARENFPKGQNAAFSQRPGLYKGIETEVAQEVYKAVNAGQIHPSQLTDTRVWDAAATMLRIFRDDTSFGQHFHGSPKPVSNVSTERPGPTVPPKEKPKLTDDERASLSAWDLTEEQYLAGKASREQG